MQQEELSLAFRKIRSLLSEKGGWTKGAIARDSRGVMVRPNDDRAQSFCLYGACCKVARGNILDLCEEIRGHVGAKYNFSISRFNDDDETKHADVLALIDKIVVRTEEE